MDAAGLQAKGRSGPPVFSLEVRGDHSWRLREPPLRKRSRGCWNAFRSALRSPEGN